MSDRTAGAEHLALPRAGRVFSTRYRVRLGDAAPGRRARLDAIARYLQDVAEDDAEDAGWPKEVGWVLRRTTIDVVSFPVLGEGLELSTFCSAKASKWAERTTTITGEAGARLQAQAVWVAIDISTGRPQRLGDFFDAIYGPSTEGRKASVRLSLGPPPPEVEEKARPWPLRASDFDVWRHVNNAISWAAVEDEVARLGWVPLRADVEHHEAITSGVSLSLASATLPGGHGLWLLSGEGKVLTAALLHRSARRA